ncbi:MAG: hypothetical protein KJ600_01955 [Nanoarchaeota archaeon]|nr:hypothetical protein [Nanoarchaeota archaeon]MBU1103300.1 hypothetical protein [Nanoarchaeota archaeon]
MSVKRGVYCCFLILFALVLASRASASSFGVSPAIYRLDFEPNLEGSFVFNFHSDNTDLDFEVGIKGDLAEYVAVDKDNFQGGSGKVNAFLKLPERIETPGLHRILIWAKPIQSASGGMGIVGSPNGVIAVYVPYPGKYAEIQKFEIENANTGEKVPYKLVVYSRGDETITASSRIEILDSANESVKVFNLGSNEIASTEFVAFDSGLDMAGVGAGNYKAVAIVKTDSGQEVRKEDSFKLGELQVKVVNYTRMLEKNKINPFEIEVESFWNDALENVYAEVFVVGTDISFLTPSVELRPWQRSKLTGYFDTTGLEADKVFQVKIVLHYGDETTEELVSLTFVETTNYILIASVISGIVAVLAFIAWVVLKIRKLEKKSGRKKR